jgi:hypothetical protein
LSETSSLVTVFIEETNYENENDDIWRNGVVDGSTGFGA